MEEELREKMRVKIDDVICWIILTLWSVLCLVLFVMLVYCGVFLWSFMGEKLGWGYLYWDVVPYALYGF